MRVVIDPGHGGNASNGRSTPYGGRGPDGTLERDVVLRLSQLVVAELGSVAQLTRYGNAENPSLGARAEVARNAEASVFVSLHANYGGPGARGTETWIHDRADRRSEALAAHVQRALIGAGCADGGIGRGALGVLAPERHFGGTAACLVEVDYLSDPSVERRFGDPGQLSAYARAIAHGIRAYGQYGDGVDGGVPNLTFGPPGPNGRALGAITPGSTPIQGSPLQIFWSPFNESATTADAHWDDVWVVDAIGREVFRDRVRVEAIRPRDSATKYAVWTPTAAGQYTLHVRMNNGAGAIPEASPNDNHSEIPITVHPASYRGVARYAGDIAVSQVNGAGGLSPRYGEELNLGSSTFHGYMRPRIDYTNRFIWLVVPRRARPGDPAPSVDIDLTMELFDEDPQRNAAAVPLDRKLRRIQLSEGTQFGYEYSRLPPETTFYIRISFVDYSPAGNAWSVLYTQGYG